MKEPAVLHTCLSICLDGVIFLPALCMCTCVSRDVGLSVRASRKCGWSPYTETLHDGMARASPIAQPAVSGKAVRQQNAVPLIGCIVGTKCGAMSCLAMSALHAKAMWFHACTHILPPCDPCPAATYINTSVEYSSSQQRVTTTRHCSVSTVSFDASKI